MHACGHDAHTASLFYWLQRFFQSIEMNLKAVKLCFQQAEEIGYGAMEL